MSWSASSEGREKDKVTADFVAHSASCHRVTPRRRGAPFGLRALGRQGGVRFPGGPR